MTIKVSSMGRLSRMSFLSTCFPSCCSSSRMLKFSSPFLSSSLSSTRQILTNCPVPNLSSRFMRSSQSLEQSLKRSKSALSAGEGSGVSKEAVMEQSSSSLSSSLRMMGPCSGGSGSSFSMFLLTLLSSPSSSLRQSFSSSSSLMSSLSSPLLISSSSSVARVDLTLLPFSPSSRSREFPLFSHFPGLSVSTSPPSCFPFPFRNYQRSRFICSRPSSQLFFPSLPSTLLLETGVLWTEGLLKLGLRRAFWSSCSLGQQGALFFLCTSSLAPFFSRESLRFLALSLTDQGRFWLCSSCWGGWVEQDSSSDCLALSSALLRIIWFSNHCFLAISLKSSIRFSFSLSLSCFFRASSLLSPSHLSRAARSLSAIASRSRLSLCLAISAISSTLLRYCSWQLRWFSSSFFFSLSIQSLRSSAARLCSSSLRFCSSSSRRSSSSLLLRSLSSSLCRSSSFLRSILSLSRAASSLSLLRSPSSFFSSCCTFICFFSSCCTCTFPCFFSSCTFTSLLDISTLQVQDGLYVVVKDGVTELDLVAGFAEELLDAFLDEGPVEDVLEGGPAVGVDLEDVADEPLELLAVGGSEGGVAALDDLEGEQLEGVGVEGRGEGAELVEEHPHGPDVGLEGVGLVLDDFGGEVVGGAHDGAGLVLGPVEHAGDAEVPQLQRVGLGDEDVLPLDVPVQDLAVVHVLHGQADLREPVQHLRLLELPLLRALGGDGLGEVAALGVLHDDFEFVVLGGVDLDEAHDEGVLEVAEDLRLLYRLLLLLLAHVLDAHLLYHQQLPRLLPPHQVRLPERPLPQQPLLLVHLVLRLHDPHLHNILIYCMKKTRKFLRFEHLRLEASQEHPRDISRAHLRIIDQANNQHYKTFNYGVVHPTTIAWDSHIELPYLSQDSFKFETLCEHEFGYEIEELKALYNGIVYIRPDQFFFESSSHCLSQEGRQCGVLRYMIKVVEREEAQGEAKVEAVEPVKVDLVAKVSVYAASLLVHSHFLLLFHKKKHPQLHLELQYKGLKYLGLRKHEEGEWRWSFNSKFEVHEGDPDQISVRVREDQQDYLRGVLPMATLEENKRFTVHVVQLEDENGLNIAALHLDLRFVSKKELLDLMYSPKQLSQNRVEREEARHFEPKKRTASALGEFQPQRKLTELLHSRALSKELSSRKVSPSQRYKAPLLTDRRESSIPRSRRFQERREVNEHISYIDPTLLSDFSPRRRQGKGTQGSTNKTDFTRGLRANPGVGEYHLPSIWEKK